MVGRLKATWLAAAACAVCGIVAIAPAAALASPAHALIADPANDTPYSFSAQADVTSIEISWTDQLVMRVSYREPPPTPDLRMLVSAAARDELDPDDERCARDLEESFTIDANRDGATFQDPAIEGSLSAPPVWDGSSVTYTFRSPTLIRRFTTDHSNPFVCLEGKAEQDAFYGAFDGRALKLTAGIAEEGVRRELDRRFRAGRKSTTRIRCLSRGKRAEVEPEGDYPGESAQRWCAYRVSIDRRTVGFGQVSVALSTGKPRTAYFFVKRLPSGSRECGTTDLVGRWLSAPFPEDFVGVSMSVWARGTSCRTARRVALRRGSRRSIYRCKILKLTSYYSSTRCRAPGGRVVWMDSGE